MGLATAYIGEVTLIPEDGRPLYRRLLHRLRDDISSGRLRPGDLIPPEVEIARRHGISRHTVRQAIVELVREGLLRRERGRGTFVVPRPTVKALGGFYSFAHEMDDRHQPYQTKLLYRAVSSASGVVAERLGVPLGAPVIEMELLRLVDGEPLGMEFSTTSYQFAPGLLVADVSARTLYDVIAEDHGVTVTFSREQIRPTVLDRRQAALLGVPNGSPAFHVERRSYAGEQVIEWRRSLIRGDRYLYRVDLPVRTTNTV